MKNIRFYTITIAVLFDRQLTPNVYFENRKSRDNMSSSDVKLSSRMAIVVRGLSYERFRTLCSYLSAFVGFSEHLIFRQTGAKNSYK